MSTNYYMVNKEDFSIEIKFKKFIKKLNKEISNLSDNFLINNYNHQVEEILNDLKKNIDYNVYSSFVRDDYLICRTTSDGVTFCGDYNNIDDFLKFYNENQEYYILLDEYDREYTINSFCKKIGYVK